ncbi:stage 0 sporulation family protein [Candidatus Oleimmundimicrobium sp.]|uniref:PSP1 domain-containing protein n=1 Tax=Candidatus Oleimmundimicrobium sp. TaxID=3060597 RepID=UPI00271E1152|nr:stage 0 sporulation family protein [Candidatus Oleimmundimicrobium sp.]MDO8886421.1 stage 0 sporulation family protein [Candidatus Oleimmundimicrobium sp.]
MSIVVGVVFKEAGKIYYFDPANIDLKTGDFVIVETSRGVEFGEITMGPDDVPDEEITAPLKEVLRKATKKDEAQLEKNKAKGKEAFEICNKKIEKYALPMKLIDVEYVFDGSKIIFYFTADCRVDFRELVKDLASVFHTRIELRQVGVRDEAKMIGGLGICGRRLCCETFLKDFEPVSIRMAKEQNLPLNPLKISGVCGRLMCCLKYEYCVYKDFKKRVPKKGTKVMTSYGEGKIVDYNVPGEKVTVEVDDGLRHEIPLKEVEKIKNSGEQIAERKNKRD